MSAPKPTKWFSFDVRVVEQNVCALCATCLTHSTCLRSSDIYIWTGHPNPLPNPSPYDPFNLSPYHFLVHLPGVLPKMASWWALHPRHGTRSASGSCFSPPARMCLPSPQTCTDFSGRTGCGSPLDVKLPWKVTKPKLSPWDHQKTTAGGPTKTGCLEIPVVRRPTGNGNHKENT